jgi:cholest-4-en-3-one 26-monooxygenase
MATKAPPLGVDLTDPATWESGIPHDVFARMRAECPVAWHPETTVPGFWSLTRYDDIVAANRDAKSLSSQLGVMLFAVPELADPDFPRMMIEVDAPKHTRYRLLVNRGFTPRMINRLEEFMRRVAVRTVEDAKVQESFDFVHEISSKLPMKVIAELLGIPESDHDYVYSVSNRIIGFDDPEYGNEGGGQAEEAMAEMCQYASALGERKREAIDAGEAPDDIVTALLRADVDGHQLSEMDFDMFVLLLSTAGNETTRTAISQAMLALFEHPDQWERLRREPDVFETMADEVLRYTTPLNHMRRTAVHDMEIGGQEVAAGDHVVLWYSSGNFDESAFDEPLRFDLGRTPNEHLTFGGGGPHYCLGAHLARLEIRVIYEELVARIPALEPDGPVERLKSVLANGIKRMPVRIA